MTLWITIGVLGLLLVGVVLVYNRLVRAKVRVRQAWAQVAVQLQRRHDLVPNLVASVRGYAGHERDILDEVTRLRAEALSESDPAQRPGAESAFGQALGRLLVLTENYPQLQADENFRHLQEQLRDTEDRLAFARGFANDRVASYRKLTGQFPTNLLASVFGFHHEEMFALDDPLAAAVPGVDLTGVEPADA